MRSVIGALRVTLGLDSAQFETGIRRAKSTLNSFGRDGNVAAGSASRLAGAFRALGVAAGAVSLAALAAGTARYADKANLLAAQLRLATQASGSFVKAQEDVRRIAAETRSGLEETAKLYGNFQRNSQELGITQAQVARATETVAKSFKISGASATDASQGLRQLTQALQSGVLRGDEFNSMAENAPRLQRLLAESLGVTQGELRKMAEEGDLTSKKLIRAFTDQKFTRGIDEEFKQMPVTFSEAMQQIDNAAIITFGAFDRGGRFSQALTGFILEGVGGFADMEAAAESFGVKARAEIEGLVGAFAPVIAEAQRLFGMMEGISSFSFEQDTKDIDAATGWLSKQGLLGRLATGNSVSDWWNGKPVSGTNLHGRFVKSRDASVAESNRQLAKQRGPWYGDTRTPTGRPMTATSDGGSAAKKRSGPSAETLARRAEQERLKAIRDQASKDRDLAQYQDDINTAKAALATAAETVLTLELQGVENSRKQRQAAIETDVKLGELSRDEADERLLLNDEIHDLRVDYARRRDAEAAAEREAATLRDRQSTMQAEAELVTAREKRRDVEMRILELAYQEEEAAIRRAAANGEIADLDEALVNMGRRRAAGEAQVQQRNESPFQKHMRSLRYEAENVGDAFEEAAVRGIDRINAGLADSVKNALGLHGILGDIIGDFIEIAMRQALVGSSGGGGLFGSILGGLGSAFGGSKVGGGSAAFNAAFAGFATGGSFRVGGSSTVGDKQLVSFRANAGEMVDIRKPGNDNGRGTIIMNNDFRGADAGAVAAISAKLDHMQRNLKGEIIGTVGDAVDRRVLRFGR